MIQFRVYEQMARAGYQTRKDLANATGISEQAIGPIVKGTVKRIDVETLNRLCRTLACKPGDLLDYVKE